MNIEIANRLVNLRKSNHLSQEALAEKLGISRQAVSKWERAEASPDTDNLIQLARLYHVSLDELLKIDEEILPDEDIQGAEHLDMDRRDPAMDGSAGKGENTSGSIAEEEYVNIGLGGVHVKDRDGSEVHIGWDGIHVEDRGKEENIHIDGTGVYVNGEKYEKEHFFSKWKLPFTTLIWIMYLILGFLFHAWHPGWLLFLLIPIWYSFVGAVRKENANLFAYPVFATLLYLCVGFFFGLWHPGWVIFLTIPLYYYVVRNINLSK